MTYRRPRDWHCEFGQQVENERYVFTFGGAQVISFFFRLRKAQLSSKSAEIETAALQALKKGAISIPSKIFFGADTPSVKFPFAENINSSSRFCFIFIYKYEMSTDTLDVLRHSE